MGLLERPAESGELVAFSVDDGLEVHVEPRYLEPPYLKQGELVFHIEGFGRFRLRIAPGA